MESAAPMPESQSKGKGNLFNRIVNGLTVVAIFCVIGLTAQRFFTPKALEKPQGPALSSVIDVPGIAWQNASNTVVVIMQVGCKFCEASAGFYRDLLSSAHKDTQFVALFPNSPEEGMAYLRSQQLSFPQVVTGDFTKLLIPGTPTLLLVSPAGRVVKKWVGRLAPSQEDEVFATLQIKRPGAAGTTSTLTKDELAALKHRILIDIRPRETFVVAHIRGAYNIPAPELGTRAVHELPKDREIVVMCDSPTGSAGCAASRAAEGVSTMCQQSEDYLRGLGFHVIPLNRPVWQLFEFGPPSGMGGYVEPAWEIVSL